MFAIGRYAVTDGCGLAAAGVNVEKNGKIKVNDVE
jgi:pyruvate/2-oxoglutarate dehydrogenase complex dihydrolipoamide dehydrogenase (E3) component